MKKIIIYLMLLSTLSLAKADELTPSDFNLITSPMVAAPKPNTVTSPSPTTQKFQEKATVGKWRYNPNDGQYYRYVEATSTPLNPNSQVPANTEKYLERMSPTVRSQPQPQCQQQQYYVVPQYTQPQQYYYTAPQYQQYNYAMPTDYGYGTMGMTDGGFSNVTMGGGSAGGCSS